MKSKIFYIIDIRTKQKEFNFLQPIEKKNVEVLSLTPYSNFLLERANVTHKTFHDYIDIETFHHTVFKQYHVIEKIFKDNLEYSFLFRDLAMIITYEVYLNFVFQIISSIKLKKYKIIYLTDTLEKKEYSNIQNIEYSYISKNTEIDKIIIVKSKDIFFYKYNALKIMLAEVLHKNFFIKVCQKLLAKKTSGSLAYDNKHYQSAYESLKPIKIKSHPSLEAIDTLLNQLMKALIHEETQRDIASQYRHIITNFRNMFAQTKNIQQVKLQPFTFLSRKEQYKNILLYKENKLPCIFMQHGSYIQENIFLKYAEIYPADINFVCNEHTKVLFEKRGAKNVFNVGSIDFNYQIVEKNKQYDYLYIVYCTSYAWFAVYINSNVNTLSLDGNNIYQRCQDIIILFGTQFKDKKICIKIQPGIFTGTMLYVPFLELSEKYANITIEFSVPIQKLISQSKYIISDYFSSEFINRELHYKRDIILFQGSPLPLPKETLDDMNKMFILVDTVDDLKEKVENIEEITKNRIRYDDIIEYYSSKKCDTKKVVTEILEKELNGR